MALVGAVWLAACEPPAPEPQESASPASEATERLEGIYRQQLARERAAR